jgi:hypothetical protein
MQKEIEVISINGVDYVKKQDLPKQSEELNGLKHAIIRTRSAGVFAGYIESQNGQEITLIKARRIYQWVGAATLSQLAMEGTSNPSACKFPEEVNRVKLFEVIEILDTTQKAKQSIDSVKVWKV